MNISLPIVVLIFVAYLVLSFLIAKFLSSLLKKIIIHRAKVLPQCPNQNGIQEKASIHKPKYIERILNFGIISICRQKRPPKAKSIRDFIQCNKTPFSEKTDNVVSNEIMNDAPKPSSVLPTHIDNVSQEKPEVNQNGTIPAGSVHEVNSM